MSFQLLLVLTTVMVYQEIDEDISPHKLENIEMMIKLANMSYIAPMGIIRNVEVLCGKTKYPTDFLVLATPQDNFCPILVDLS